MKDTTGDQPQVKTIVRLCPIMSTAISWTVKDKKTGKETRLHSLAECPCIQGRCALFIIGTGCGLIQ